MDRGAPASAQPNRYGVFVGRRQRRDTLIFIDRRSFVDRRQNRMIGKGDVGRCERGAVGEPYVAAQMIDDAQTVARNVAVRTRRNAGEENRDIAIVLVETDESLTPEQIEAALILGERVKRTK